MPASPSPLASPLAWDLVSKDYALETVPQFELFAQDALGLVTVTAKSRVLDVACGPGTLALIAARHVAHVDAIDFSAAMTQELLRRASEMAIRNIDVRVGNGQSLPYEDGVFDAAFSMFGLMFFPERVKGLSEMCRVLKPGGSAVISSWLPFENMPLFARLMEELRQKIPDLPFGQGKAPLGEADEIRDEMQSAGLSQVRVERASHAIEAPSLEAFWGGLQRTMAPLVLLQKKLGPAAWNPIAQNIRASLEKQVGSGAQRVEMQAWLGLGRA
jgi:ubiquinone/menaquinone biosynthesis C-methylase UbiE